MPDAGRILFDGQEITCLPAHRRARLGLARSFQITSIFEQMTVAENIALAVQAHMGHSFRFWRAAANDRQLLEPTESALERVGLALAPNGLLEVDKSLKFQEELGQWTDAKSYVELG